LGRAAAALAFPHTRTRPHEQQGNLFKAYVANEFVGADMARKFLQMGYTRSRRYANYTGGSKNDPAR
jgi:hypothetical protein